MAAAAGAGAVTLGSFAGIGCNIGPNAYIQCYEDLNFFDSVFWLLPDQRVEDTAQLACNDDIDSLRLFDRPPFAHEPAYTA